MTRPSDPAGGPPANPATNRSGGSSTLPPAQPDGGEGQATATARPAGRTGATRVAGPGLRPGTFRPALRWQDTRLVTALFLVPALVILAAVVVYPIVATIWYSLFNADSTRFVGAENYIEMFTAPATRKAITNNVIWVIVAPSIVTALGLVFAVLTERVRLATAFKTVLFMPMAISFLAAGVTFTLVYQADKDRGALNAAVVTVHDVFQPSSKYHGVTPRDGAGLTEDHGSVRVDKPVNAGVGVALPMVGLPVDRIPADAAPAAPPGPGPGVRGTVWLDFAPGGGGKPGVVDRNEVGLPGMTVEALRGGTVLATTDTDAAGRFAFDDLAGGGYEVRLAADNFRPPFNGVTWLGGRLVTPSIITAFIWIWAGFAMVLIAAGLAAIPREALESARVDGATEWQVFRWVTIPLVRPVLVVVLVTLTINVLKIFDLVLVLAPDPTTQDQANVMALQMYQTAFLRRDYGLGSALAVLLFVLVLPAMLYNVRKLRRDR